MLGLRRGGAPIASLIVEPVSFGHLSVWDAPVDGREYIVGVDVAEGKIRDSGKLGRVIESAEHSRDYSCAMVIDRIGAHLVACWHGDTDTNQFSDVVYNLGVYYNTALVAVEVTGPGHAVMLNLVESSYPNCFIPRQVHRLKQNVGENAEYGWKTNIITRPLMMDAVMEMIQVATFEIPDRDLLREMMTMSRDNRGEPRAMGKNKDDRVFAYAIALCARKQEVTLLVEEKPGDKYKHLPASDRQEWMRLDEEEAETKQQERDEMSYVE